MAREHALEDAPEAAHEEEAQEIAEAFAADAPEPVSPVEVVEPVEAPAEPEPEAEPEPDPEPEDETPDLPTAPPEPPKVVTRTRRRGGTRTAGNATVAPDVPETAEAAAIDAALGAPPQDGLVEPGTADSEPATTAAHVPIKRKGRKR